MINLEFDLTFSVEGSAFGAESASVQNSYGANYPSILIKLNDKVKIIDPDRLWFGTRATLTVGLYSGGSRVKTLTYAGMVAKVTLSENLTAVSTDVVLIPESGRMSSITGSFDGINMGLEHSARALIQAIIASYNSSFPANAVRGLIFGCLDYIPITAPRFVNMTYMEMIATVLGERGLNFLITFDNRAIVYSYLSSSGTAKRIGSDKMALDSFGKDIITKSMV